MAEVAVPVDVQERLLPWWVVLIEGILAFIIGVLLLSSPGMTMLVLIQILGIWWLIHGFMRIVAIFIDSSLWGWKLFAGAIGILAGLVVIQHPLWAGIFVPTIYIWLLGILGLVGGFAMLIEAFQGSGLGAGILGGISLLFGLVLVFNPLIGTAVLPWVLGVFAIAGGILAIIASFQIRKVQAV